MTDTRVNLLGVELSNPVIPASGTFGYGREFAELYDINILGTFSFKGAWEKIGRRASEMTGGILGKRDKF